MPHAHSSESSDHRGENNHLTLQEISENTGIPYPRLVRHYRLHKQEIPHRIIGGTRVFPREATKVFYHLEKGSEKKGYDKVHVASRASGSDIRAKLRIKKAETKRARRALREAGVDVRPIPDLR